MKKLSTSVLLCTLAFAGSSGIYQAAMANNPIKSIIGSMESGDYNFKSYDQGLLKENYLNKFRDSQTEQKKFVEKTVTEINIIFGMFLEESVYGEAGMQKMYDESVRGSKVYDFETEYLTTIRKYKKSLASLQNKVMSLTAIPGALEAPTDVSLEDINIVKLPGLLDGIDFTDIIKHYQDQVDSINLYYSAAKYKVKSAMGEALAEGLEWAPNITMSPGEIAKIKREVKGLRSVVDDPDYVTPMNAYTSILKKEVNSFVETYGTTERFRVQTDGQKKLRDEALAMISEHFWLRSYLRDLYGVQIGTILLSYDKSIANLDIVTTDTKDLINFNSNSLWKTADMIRLKQDVMNLLNRARERSQDVFGEGIDTFDRIASAAVFLQGKRPLAKVNAWMLELIKNDIDEEMMLANGDYMGLRAHYSEHYMSTEKNKNAIFDLMDKWDPEKGSEFDTGVLNDSQSKLQSAKDALNIKELQIFQADEKESFVDAVSAANTRSQARDNRRRKRGE